MSQPDRGCRSLQLRLLKTGCLSERIQSLYIQSSKSQASPGPRSGCQPDPVQYVPVWHRLQATEVAAPADSPTVRWPSYGGAVQIAYGGPTTGPSTTTRSSTNIAKQARHMYLCRKNAVSVQTKRHSPTDLDLQDLKTNITMIT